jgi:putative ABC transport system substrate-binding protein
MARVILAEPLPSRAPSGTIAHPESWANMRRREFIGLVGGAATWPLAAGAQPSTMPMIGVLESEPDQIFVPALQKGLRQSGFIEGQISPEAR